MIAISPAVVFTVTEIRSYLPSGWGIAVDGTGHWDPKKGRWSLEIYDGADNTWKIEVRGEDAQGGQRLPALKEAIDRVARKSLGRKSVITG